MRDRLSSIVAIALPIAVHVMGCSGSGPGNTGQIERAPDPATAPNLATVAKQLVGSWRNGGTSETWMERGGHLLGVGFTASSGTTRQFEVLLVHPAKGRLVYTAMPDGKRSVDFAVVASKPGAVKVFNPTHDHPKQIEYRRQGTTLAITVSGDNGAHAQTLSQQPDARAARLEALDKAFAADSLERGGAAWAARFEEEGVHWPSGSPRTVGSAAVAAGIDALRAKGLELRWAPAYSGLSPAGDMGYTAGAYRVMRESNAVAAGLYVSIWRRDSKGIWKIAFDTGVRLEGGK